MDAHNAAVQRISDQVRGFYERLESFRIYHGSTNSTRQQTFDRRRMVDTSQLTHVLEVNATARTCKVEPNVPMDRLVAALLPHGLLPPVVMEFPGITVGGGYSGTSGESSSFKHGYFDSTIISVEFVLPTGEVVKASKTETPDLFFGAPAALGTLGVSTLFEIQLVQSTSYVEVVYHPVDSVKAALQLMKSATEDPANDYVDGIVLSRDRSVIVTGRRTNTVSAGAQVQRFSRAVDPWFYIHVERMTKNTNCLTPLKEAVPITDYLFRYDRGAFWTGAYAYKYFMVPFNRITRWALDDFMKTRVMYHALHASGHSERYIIQDMALPASNVEAFVDFIDETFGFYPLWLCPLAHPQHKSMHPRVLDDPGVKGADTGPDQLVNIGVWGPGPTEQGAWLRANRKLEQKLHELRGMKWLYAQTYYTEDEFWDIYDKSWYDALRAKYHASHLPSVYDKVKTDLSKYEPPTTGRSLQTWVRDALWATWPVSGVYGVLQTLVSNEYLLGK